MKSNLAEQRKSYYSQVAEYYDREAADFEKHYSNNIILQRLRHDFRKITEQYSFSSALEIGCGPGLDLAYFGHNYPERLFRGIDVSEKMVMIANRKFKTIKADVQAYVATPETMESNFPDLTFDLIYCYFGALNTVFDLEQTAAVLRRMVSADGALVLTFVNRWFLFDILWNMLRLRFRKAFFRLGTIWPGYAPDRSLESACRSARQITRSFSPHFNLEFRKGYSIVYPAWFRHRFIDTRGRLGKWLWSIDQLLNRTPFWNLGEYSFYVFRPK
ncbi:methyltransferase domain-containing protein [candidate division KSB1 bacterium]|nr:methyltransferase domain-containing protein [candidate division KSB1 bacterium]